MKLFLYLLRNSIPHFLQMKSIKAALNINTSAIPADVNSTNIETQDKSHSKNSSYYSTFLKLIEVLYISAHLYMC